MRLSCTDWMRSPGTEEVGNFPAEGGTPEQRFELGHNSTPLTTR
jgi:hypothetical protein